MIRYKNVRGLYLLFFVLMAFLIAGCQAVPPSIQCDFRTMQPQAVPTGPVLVSPIPGSITPIMIGLNGVNITDGTISNKVMVQATNAKRLETGNVEVFARIVNCTDYPLQVEARTHFLDARQVDAEPMTAWNRIYLSARSIGSYSDRSTAGTAVESYLIELREGR